MRPRDTKRAGNGSPGSLLTMLGFLAVTFGLALYAKNFGHYGATYGSLGAVVVLLLWLYLSAYVLLLGAELNAELEKKPANNDYGEFARDRRINGLTGGFCLTF